MSIIIVSDNESFAMLKYVETESHGYNTKCFLLVYTTQKLVSF